MERLEEALENIDQELSIKLLESMPERIQVLIGISCKSNCIYVDFCKLIINIEKYLKILSTGNNSFRHKN